MKDGPLCKRCGKPVSQDDDVYGENLMRHHGHRECAKLDEEQIEAWKNTAHNWDGKERECPKCKTRFTSVQNKGACPECQHIFYAGPPDPTMGWWMPRRQSPVAKWLKKRVTLAKVEAMASGSKNHRWRDFLAHIQDGDELWMFCSSRKSWQHRAGSKGIALVRNGEVVTHIVTAMN